MREGVLQVEGLRCSYGEQRVLHGLDVQLCPGQITAVLGRSGCGKSTLLRAIAGFEPVREGQISLGEQLYSKAGFTLPPEERGIGIVVQNFALFPHLTIWKNATFGASSEEQRALAKSLLEQVGLADRAGAYPHELSGGEQQRIAVIRALVPQPKVVLLDEAFSSLDRQMREALRQETARLLRSSGAAVCVVTHDVDEALEMADNLVIMEEGNIIAQGRGDDLFWRPENARAGRMLGDINEIEGACGNGVIATAFGDLPCPGDLPEGPVRLLVRPSAIAIQPPQAGAAGANILEINFRGPSSTLTLGGTGGATLIASATGARGFAVGDTVSIDWDMLRLAIVQAQQS